MVEIPVFYPPLVQLHGDSPVLAGRALLYGVSIAEGVDVSAPELDVWFVYQLYHFVVI